MIFSRTVSSDDVEYFNLSSNIIEYLQHPRSIKDYSSGIAKFWEYSILLKLIEYYNLKNPTIMVVTAKDDGIALSIIAEYKNFKVFSFTIKDFLKIKIRPNQYDIVCCFGGLEFSKNEYVMLSKLSKHVKKSGYLVLTTSQYTNKALKKFSVEDVLDMSILLEDSGFDFCSDEDYPLKYNSGSDLHSLVMEKIGN